MFKPTFELEQALHQEGCSFVIGVDEAGRGGLIGPVSAASVYVPPEALKHLIGKVDDSKKLTARKREELAKIIKELCKYKIAFVDHETIDRINI